MPSPHERGSTSFVSPEPRLVARVGLTSPERQPPPFGTRGKDAPVIILVASRQRRASLSPRREQQPQIFPSLRHVDGNLAGVLAAQRERARLDGDPTHSARRVTHGATARPTNDTGGTFGFLPHVPTMRRPSSKGQVFGTRREASPGTSRCALLLRQSSGRVCRIHREVGRREARRDFFRNSKTL